MPQQKAKLDLLKGQHLNIFPEGYLNFEKQSKSTKASATRLWDIPSLTTQAGCTGCQKVQDAYLGIKVGALEKKVKELDLRLQTIESHGEVVEEVEDVPLKEAKKRIALYFKENDGKEIDYGDLVEALHIPLPTIVNACEKLEREGKIAGVD